MVLALLGLDLGRAPCDAARFVSLLAAPPAWEQLDTPSFRQQAIGAMLRCRK